VFRVHYVHTVSPHHDDEVPGLQRERGVEAQVACERHVLKPGLMFKGKGLKPVAFKLMGQQSSTVQLAPPHRGEHRVRRVVAVGVVAQLERPPELVLLVRRAVAHLAMPGSRVGYHFSRYVIVVRQNKVQLMTAGMCPCNQSSDTRE
jgi:hypothetical protein